MEHSISRGINEDMKNEPDNDRKQGQPYEPSNDVCKMSITNTEMGHGKFKAATPLGTRRPWTKGRFQLSQPIAICNTVVPMGLSGGTDGT